ncbi:TPA: hypothetical protein U2M34_000252 [Providencia rettgeri]|nr:hypothetical protein [Providencia rettgeri]
MLCIIITLLKINLLSILDFVIDIFTSGHLTIPSISFSNVSLAGVQIEANKKPAESGFIFDVWIKKSTFSIDIIMMRVKHSYFTNRNTLIYIEWLFGC